MSHYLGPGKPPTPLTDWDEVVSAASGGLLSENQWCELKKGRGPSGQNLEMARDLASLSVDGGVLLYGVRDDFEVVGFDASEVSDRIAQVASMNVHPSLSPLVREIPSPDDESKSLIVVTVPASSEAPHMVDGRYWGRSSNGKDTLSDATVRRLLPMRLRKQEAFERRLLDMCARNPVIRVLDGPSTGPGYIYLMAEPMSPVLGRTEDFSLANSLATHPLGRQLARIYYPSPDSLGQALLTHPSPISTDNEPSAAYLLLRDSNSSLELVVGGATQMEAHGELSIRTDKIAEIVAQFHELLRHLALTNWGFTGQWRIGIHIDGLSDAVITSEAQRHRMPFVRDSFTYHRAINPSTWNNDLEPEARKLLAGFIRGIDREGWSLWELAMGRRGA